MQKISAFIFLLFIGFFSFGQEPVVVEGFAKYYAGQSISISEIEDYLSDVTKKVEDTVVQADSTFYLSFPVHQTQKYKITLGDKDYFYIYAEPGAHYYLYINEKNPYPSEFSPAVNLEYLFLHLDSSDINYKTLVFDNNKMDFLQEYYHYDATHSYTFAKKLDSFKTVIHNRYKEDTSKFFKVYVKYSFAALDDLHFKGERGDIQKYQFYIRPSKVWYHNDRYMNYILRYFEDYLGQLPNENLVKFTSGVKKSSPSLIMEGLDGVYSLRNLRLRELIMIDMLAAAVRKKAYPKKNVLTILDSLSNYSLFAANRPIAKNIKYRLTSLNSGAPLPKVKLNIEGKEKDISDYKGHHLYIQFINPTVRSADDVKLLKDLYKKYNGDIQFLSVLVVGDDKERLLKHPDKYKEKHGITWDFSVVKQSDSLLSQLNVVSFPYYILVDANGQVVAAPALTPRPNGEYHTIELKFYKIQQRYKALEKNNRRRRW